MGRIKSKIGLILIGYSLLITTIFVISLGVLLKTFEHKNSYELPSVLFTLNKEIIEGSIEINTESIPIRASSISRNTIDNYYNKQLNDSLPIVILVVCTFTIIFTFLLWLILRRIDRAEIISIAKKLENISSENDINNLDPLIAEVYKDIKSKFTYHMEDYKRLNSYISHEQKNSISILKTKLEMHGEKELIHSLDKISHSIEDILTISDSNDIENMSIIDAAYICAEVCDEYKRAFSDIHFDFDEEGNTNIYGKERWIYRAIANLLDNAIKYGRNNSIIVKIINEKGSVIISIKDNGIGMDEKSKTRIFDNRYRINELKKDGYGIGLSLVNYVCSLCDGYIWVESKPNEGSTFYLVFREA